MFLSVKVSFLLFVCCGSLLAETDTENYPECGPNEVLNKCVGCPIEDFCNNGIRGTCPPPSETCNAACVCKEGFIRKARGYECIPKEKCKGECNGVFEEYTDCKQCANETCSSIVNPVKCDSEVQCTPGCTCWDGYYRLDENSTCLPRCTVCPGLEDTPECMN